MTKENILKSNNKLAESDLTNLMEDIRNALSDAEILPTYEAIINFINWYNNNQK